MSTLALKPRCAKPLWAGHPWVHASSVAHIDSAPEDDWVRVVDDRGAVVGTGLYSAQSALRVRIVDFGSSEGNEALLDERITKAAALRTRLFPDPQDTNAYRLVHAEADGLPGLVVDRFGHLLSAQFATAPMWRRRERLAQVLLEATGAELLIARPGGHEDVEGIDFEPFTWPNAAVVPETLDIHERGLALTISPRTGQKTGHYCDQRENRVAVARWADGRRVLDLFCGTGGFLLQAMRHGAASGVGIDSSAGSVRQARASLRELGLTDRAQVLRADVTDHLKSLKAQNATYDIVVLDPPNLLPRRGPDHAARKHLRELIVRALTRVSPGGLLAVFSCSPRIDREALLDLTASASRDCRRRLRCLEDYTAGPDHPVLPVRDDASPRLGQYLSGHLVEVAPW